MSSSPGLPSPSVLLFRMESDRSTTPRTSKLSVITDDGFMSVASLLRSEKISNGKDESGNVQKRSPTLANTSDSQNIKPRPRIAQQEHTEGRKLPKTGSKLRKDEIEDTTLGSIPKAKSRGPTKKIKAQSKIAANSITKPSQLSTNHKKRRTLAQECGNDVRPLPFADFILEESTCQQEESNRATRENGVSGPVKQDLLLDAAGTRKRHWTPPIDTASATSDSVTASSGHHEADDFAHSRLNDAKEKGSENFFSTFVYCDSIHGNNSGSSSRDIRRDVFRKPKRIDLVGKSHILDLTASDKKPKAMKRPRTITERATAMYEAENSTADALISQYVTAESPGGTKSLKSDIMVRKNVTKPKKSTSNMKKSQMGLAPKLLQPSEALKEIDEQQLLFGTSSQLAEGAYPRVAKDTQDAVLTSAEAIESDQPHLCRRVSADESSKQSPTLTRDLWSAATRKFDGSLMSPRPLQPIDSIRCNSFDCAPKNGHHRLRSTSPVNNGSCTCVDRAEPLAQSKPSNHVHIPYKGVTNVPKIKCTNTAIITLAKAPIARLSDRVPSATGEHISAPSNIPLDESVPSSAAPDAPDMPMYEGFPTSRLTKELRSYGFKPIKSREQMIVILKKCWEAKHRVALQTLQSNVLSPTRNVSLIIDEAKRPSIPLNQTLVDSKLGELQNPAHPVPPNFVPTDSPIKKPRGRPRKKGHPSTTATVVDPKQTRVQKKDCAPQGRNPIDIPKRVANAPIEVSESRTKLSSTSTTHQVSSQTSKITKEDLPSADDPSSSTQAAAQSRMFKYITQAVTAVPPSTDIDKPTWHEKILMYDTIVLEDLCWWLNTQGLASIGVDSKVGDLQVKEWCWTNSVCCVGEENLAGGARSRH